VATGVVLIEGDDSDAEKPAQPKAPVAQAKQPVTTPTQPAKTAFAPTWSAKPATPPAPPAKPTGEPTQQAKATPAPVAPAKPAALDAGRLRQQIQVTCGELASDVEVTVQSDKSLSVRVKSKSMDDGEKLSEKIFGMPELGPYQVSLDVQVVQ
jgi:hypothetical protein